jgi:catechol 1,2-dioxygenase
MPTQLISSDVICSLAARAAGLDQPGGNPRLKTIMNRLLHDLFVAIDDLDIQMDEVWAGIGYLGKAAATNELGLVVPGIGLEHFLDLRLDETERRAGLSGGTARTIEGPLYIPDAPLSKGEARLDDGSDDAEVLFMEGRVTDTAGKPIHGAIVDVWHADSRGFYSHFGPPQTPFNMRRRIETDGAGRYRFRSIMPSGYGCPPGSNSEALMKMCGRHAQRPAHIHFFITAPGHRQLTTQINIVGDKYLFDDFAFGTRDTLIPEIVRHDDPQEIRNAGLNKPFSSIAFDFAVCPERNDVVGTIVTRERATAGEAAAA